MIDKKLSKLIGVGVGGGFLSLIFLILVGVTTYTNADNTFGIQSFRDSGAYCDYGDCTNEAVKQLTTFHISKGYVSFMKDNDYYQIVDRSGSYTKTNTNVTYETKKVLKYDESLGGYVIEKVKVPSGVTTETERHHVTSYNIGGNYCAEHLEIIVDKIKNDVVVATLKSFWFLLLFIVLYIIVLIGLIVSWRKAKRETV